MKISTINNHIYFLLLIIIAHGLVVLSCIAVNSFQTQAMLTTRQNAQVTFCVACRSVPETVCLLYFPIAPFPYLLNIVCLAIS